jgi:hypothetical protein
MYPMLGTCPNLGYAIATLGHHAANLGSDNQCALKHIFRYLKATSNQQLIFRCGAPSGSMLLGYTDADWATNVNDHKSMLGYVFTLAGTAVSWSSKKQTSIALSSTEAEYVTRAHTAKKAIWLRQLLSELGLDVSSPTVLHIDNQSAITIVKNPEFHDHTKHIDVCYHFLQQVVKSIQLSYTLTGEQVANVLTKGLPPASHIKFTEAMGVHCLN